MKLRTRGRWGVQAGLLAGIAVAAAFFALDLVQMAPLSTPLAISRSVVQAGMRADPDGLWRTAADLSPGGRLAAFTALHLAVFGIFGMLAAGLANLFHVRWNGRSGGLAGLLVGLAAWVLVSRAGPVWLAEAHLSIEAVLGAAVVGGAVMGWHLRLCRLDAEEAPSLTRASDL